MRRLFSTIFFSSLLTGAAIAGQPPTTLEVISGPVYVDQGYGLTEVDQFTLLEVGDRILIKAGQTALLMNNSLGCTISLRDAGLYRVPDLTECHVGQASVLKSEVMITPANGVFVPVRPGYAGGGGAGSGSVMAGLGFFGLVALTVVANTILEESPVSTP